MNTVYKEVVKSAFFPASINPFKKQLRKFSQLFFCFILLPITRCNDYLKALQFLVEETKLDD
ncbi:hypothetical protein DTX73_11125 [Enterococcus faecium]|uniref:Uncharacterized protein n=1 Tax=Enterococcus faecium TaxID=1352 RepID=A0A7V7GL17_ENTFC|nr:hypothetical protein DTX73_11125 [Enterococcus faecium]